MVGMASSVSKVEWLGLMVEDMAKLGELTEEEPGENDDLTNWSALWIGTHLFLWSAPVAGSHLRLPSGPAGIRTTTGSLSALARPTPYQLSHRVAYYGLGLIMRPIIKGPDWFVAR